MFEIYSIHGFLLDRFDDESQARRCFAAWAQSWFLFKGEELIAVRL